MEKSVSVIVSTHNRARRLPHCLEALARLDPTHIRELVVVDNASTDDTAAVAGAYAAGMPFPVRLVREPLPGLARARNAGIRASSGPIIAFTDDDCYPAEDWATRIHEVFADHPAVGFLGGRIHLFDPRDAMLTINYSQDLWYFPPGKFIDSGAVQGANMAFRREALEAVGLCDPLLGAGAPFGSEDCDLCTRVCLAGYAGGHFPGPLVYHHHGRDEAAAKRLMREYDFGRGHYYAKFMLRPGSRVKALRNWFWFFRFRLRTEPGRALVCLGRELVGAGAYTAWHLRHRTFRGSGGARSQAF